MPENKKAPEESFPRGPKLWPILRPYIPNYLILRIALF